MNKNNNRKPNVVFILADDMGWMDCTINGSKYYETPNIDRLADMGMLFTDAYAANPLCSPTRASLMSGKYPGRLKITTPSCHLPVVPDKPLINKKAQPWVKVIPANSRRCLPLDEYTLGDAFKDAGYATGFIGKWHLGREEQYWPRNRGFEMDMGSFHAGPPSYFSPYNIHTIKDGNEGEYITDRVTNEALKYIQDKKDVPFMLCLWHFAVHGPWGCKKEKYERYLKKTDPSGRQDCAVMAAMLESLDESVGRVLDKLEELGISDNTIVIFMSDNGGNVHTDLNGTPPTNNEPLRSGKGDIYEGGVRVPCIISWPDVIKSGSVCKEAVSSVDIYPTLLQMAGIEKNKNQIVDGESLLPLLKGDGKLSREAIFCHFPHNVVALNCKPCTSVRQGDWKLIRTYYEGGNGEHKYELYNLIEDISEKNNLAAKMPEKVRELDELITQHLINIDAVIPVINPNYDPGAISGEKKNKTVMPYIY